MTASVTDGDLIASTVIAAIRYALEAVLSQSGWFMLRVPHEERRGFMSDSTGSIVSVTYDAGAFLHDREGNILARIPAITVLIDPSSVTNHDAARAASRAVRKAVLPWLGC